MKRKVIIPILIVTAIVTYFGVKLVLNKKIIDKKEEVAMQQQIFELTPIKTHTVSSQSLAYELNQSGTFIAQQDLKLAAQAQGKIKKLYIKTSQFVTEGTLIATIDDTGLTSQLSTAKASLISAQQNAERMQNSLESGGVTQQQVENADLQVKNAQTTLTQLEQQSANYKIVAPTNGVINEIFAETGSFVSPGTPIVQLVDITQVLLIVSVNQSMISSIKLGQKVNVSCDSYQDIIFDGTVATVNVKADASQKIEVGILVANTKEHPILAGVYGQAEFITDTNAKEISVLTIPRIAILGSILDPKVYVVKSDSTVTVKSLTVGRTIDKNIEVVSGLKSGEQVVTAGQINLEEGTKVTIKN